jgi:hypothetical protein
MTTGVIMVMGGITIIIIATTIIINNNHRLSITQHRQFTMLSHGLLIINNAPNIRLIHVLTRA